MKEILRNKSLATRLPIPSLALFAKQDLIRSVGTTYAVIDDCN